MRVLVGCEESQTVMSAFLELGADAYSCDIKPCSGPFPDRHIQDDLLKYISVEYSNCWDIVILHPPCTFLSNCNNRAFSLKCNSSSYVREKLHQRELAIDFFYKCINAPFDRLCVENPVGIMNTLYRIPDQIIHPYFFASSVFDTVNYQLKKTCLWLKGLNPLFYRLLPKPSPLYTSLCADGKYHNVYFVEGVSSSDRSTVRSKFFPGVAAAMASQWIYPQQLRFF